MLTYGEASYSYGPRGDLRRKIVGTDTTSYDYDNLGNLRSVELPDGTLIEYLIDGQNRRVAKKMDGTIVNRWIYQDQLNPLAEVDSLGNVTARFVYGSKVHVPGYMIKNDTTYAIITDHLGSVRLVVDAQSGEIRQRMDYDEYGNVLADSNPGFQPFGYAGGLYDEETGLVRFGARDYDPEVGRWTSKDPILFEGEDPNLYVFIINDPINFVDPIGLLRVPDYVTLTVNLAIPTSYTATLFGVTVSLTIDKHGNLYSGGGLNIGKAATGISGSLVAGWLNNQPCEPTGQEMNNFLSGHGINVGAGFILGGGITYSPSTNSTSTEFGLFSTQAGFAYTYTVQDGNLLGRR